MDLLSSIRKEGSRGGVDFKWDDVKTSQRRENYMGHSLMAPVGRWQKGKDLSWYAKADSDGKVLNKDGTEETAEEKRVRERKEEIRRIKEAEEDALARALGRPVADRGNGLGTGANNIDVGEMKRLIKETEAGDDEIEEVGRGRRFGDFVGRIGMDRADQSADQDIKPNQGGLIGATQISKRPHRTDQRSRSRERKHRHHRHRDRSRDQRENPQRRRHRDGGRHRERTKHSPRPRPRPQSRDSSRSSQPRSREGRKQRSGDDDRQQVSQPYDEPRARSRTPPVRDTRQRRGGSEERRWDRRGERDARDQRARRRTRSPPGGGVGTGGWREERNERPNARGGGWGGEDWDRRR